MKKHTLLLVLCIHLLFASAVYAQEKSPRTFQRDNQGCPPGGTLSTYHWDNGKGDDLTVDVICVGNGADAYVSTKITQSKAGKNTEVANPDGTGGTESTGHC